jgi:hypothetical protein
MSNVLLVTEDESLVSQAELLAIELEKNGHKVTFSPASHPLRLINGNFQTVHLLAKTVPLKSKQYLFALAAQALSISVVLSLFDKTVFSKFSHLQIKSIDALTAFSLGQYNQLKLFNKNKMIFPGIVPSTKIISPKVARSQPIVVFPIMNSLNELPKKINFTSSSFIVDASWAATETKKNIKRQWAQWKKGNPQNERAVLTTQWSTVAQIAKDQGLVLVTSHLALNSARLMQFCVKATSHRAIWISNKDQASAFSQVWNKLEGRLVPEDDFTFIDDFFNGLSPFEATSNDINEVKTNELARFYSRVQNEKSTLASRLSGTINT